MKRLENEQKRFSLALEQHLYPYFNPNSSLSCVVKYAMGRGKRMRPAIVYALGEDFKLDNTQMNCLSVCLESMHCYSLVHDDLPSMDNSALRRNQPTCHVKFDEPSALLAGNWLQQHAWLLFAALSTKNTQDLATYFSRYTANEGLLVGQADEFSYLKKNSPSIFEVEKIARYKTAGLFQLSFTLPLMINNIHHPDAPALTKMGVAFGLLFQALDDKEDIEEDAKNQEQNKNLMLLLGADKTKKYIETLTENIFTAHRQLSQKTPALMKIIKLLLQH